MWIEISWSQMLLCFSSCDLFTGILSLYLTYGMKIIYSTLGIMRIPFFTSAICLVKDDIV